MILCGLSLCTNEQTALKWWRFCHVLWLLIKKLYALCIVWKYNLYSIVWKYLKQDIPHALHKTYNTSITWLIIINIKLSKGNTVIQFCLPPLGLGVRSLPLPCVWSLHALLVYRGYSGFLPSPETGIVGWSASLNCPSCVRVCNHSSWQFPACDRLYVSVYNTRYRKWTYDTNKYLIV